MNKLKNVKKIVFPAIAAAATFVGTTENSEASTWTYAIVDSVHSNQTNATSSSSATATFNVPKDKIGTITLGATGAALLSTATWSVESGGTLVIGGANVGLSSATTATDIISGCNILLNGSGSNSTRTKTTLVYLGSSMGHVATALAPSLTITKLTLSGKGAYEVFYADHLAISDIDFTNGATPDMIKYNPLYTAAARLQITRSPT